MKRALITGVAGQDGSYLKEMLEQKGYSVTGIERENGDLFDNTFVKTLVSKRYDEFYNFASVSTVESPWDDPVGVVTSTGLIPLTILEAMRTESPSTRFFQASSAEMYGDPVESPQHELTPLRPRSPYGIGKAWAHEAIQMYRREHGLFAVSGILFNHESPRRGERFVTRKITSTLSRIAKGSDEVLELGNLDAKRDWSFAGDIVRGMWMALQHEQAGDYVFASGEVHSVREFVEAAAQALGLTINWEGRGVEEKGVSNGKIIVAVNPQYFRPLEKQLRQGDISKARRELGWAPEASFSDLVKMMAQADADMHL